MKMNNP